SHRAQAARRDAVAAKRTAGCGPDLCGYSEGAGRPHRAGLGMNGARWLVEALSAEGVDTLFGYPGGAIMPFYDALYGCELKHVLVRHEQGAAFAANGYARASGRVGVCIATSGPGATNLVT